MTCVIRIMWRNALRSRLLPETRAEFPISSYSPLVRFISSVSWYSYFSFMDGYYVVLNDFSAQTPFIHLGYISRVIRRRRAWRWNFSKIYSGSSFFLCAILFLDIGVGGGSVRTSIRKLFPRGA